MTKILVVGDTHGDISFASKACRVAEKHMIDTVIQVGDFGIWDHIKEGVYFLDKLDENAGNRGVRWIFLPGNHENYERLENYELVAEEQDLWTDEGFVPIRDNVLYTGKVNTWTWEEKTFKAVGGAVSIDKYARVPGKSWWPQEQLTDDELAFAKRNRADYLFTHDCPTNAPFGGRLKPDLDSVAHRQKMDEVGRATQARIWLHGHMHSFYDYWFPYSPKGDETKVYGLECNDNAMWWGANIDGGFMNMAILDTDDDRVHFPNTGNV